MRISTSLIHQQATAQLSKLGTETALSQQRIASGQKLLKPSDDPIAAARILELNQDLAQRAQYLRNTEVAQPGLQSQDAVISQVVDSLQRVRELTLQAGGGGLTPQDRTFIAQELQARLEEMQSLLNSKGVDGNYMFAGFEGDRQPFADIGGQLAYVGDQGEKRIQIDSQATAALGVNGFRLFENVSAAEVVPWVQIPENNVSDVLVRPRVIDQEAFSAFSPDNLVLAFSQDPATGELLVTATSAADGRIINGVNQRPYAQGMELANVGLTLEFSGPPNPGDGFLIDSSPNRGLLGTAKEIAVKLSATDSAANSENDALRGLIDNTLIELDSHLNNMLSVQAEIGANQNRIASTAELHQTLELQTTQALSGLRDVDFAQAVSDLSYQAFLLEAAQQSFVRINNLSLFNAL